jgi:preprotein translocase subunit YajC
MLINTILAAAAPEAGRDPNQIWQTLIMIGIALIFFYFILWRPEQKRRNQMEQKRRSLKKGDIVIAMGIRAKIYEIKDKTVILSNYDDSKIEVLLAAITDVEKPECTVEKN